MKKTYIQPETQCYTLDYTMPLLAGSIIGDVISDDIAIGDDPSDNLVREFDFGSDFDFDATGSDENW